MKKVLKLALAAFALAAIIGVSHGKVDKNAYPGGGRIGGTSVTPLSVQDPGGGR